MITFVSMQEINSHPALKETINLVEIVGVFHLSQFHKYIKFWGIKNNSKIYGIILYRARRISKREFNEGGYVTLLPKVTGLLKTGVQSMT